MYYPASKSFLLFILPLLLYLGVALILTPHITHAAGNTYYVAVNGNDANPCSQSSPCRTIATGISKLSAGDTLYLRGGTYNEKIESSPSGSSWLNPVTIAAYPGEAVTLSTAGTVIGFYREPSPVIQYVIFDGLKIDAQNSVMESS